MHIRRYLIHADGHCRSIRYETGKPPTMRHRLRIMVVVRLDKSSYDSDAPLRIILVMRHGSECIRVPVALTVKDGKQCLLFPPIERSDCRTSILSLPGEIVRLLRRSK